MLQLMLAAMLAAQSPAEAAQEKAQLESIRVAERRRGQLAASLWTGTPRERALGAAMYTHFITTEGDSSKAKRGAILRRAAEEASNDPLVQLLWAHAPDDASGCDASNPCPGRREALARLEPENGFAWTPALNAAVKRGDAKAVDDALVRIAAGTRFDDYFIEGRRAWLAALRPRIGLLGAHSEEHVQNAAVAEAALLTPGPSQVTSQCMRHRHPAANAVRVEACAGAGRLMSRTGTSVLTQRLGLGALRGAGVADDAEDRAVRRQQDWLMANMSAVFRDPDSNQAEVKQYFADLDATGSEQRTWELALQRNGVSATPPAGWQAPKRD